MKKGLYDYKGERLTLRQIEERCGVNRHTLYGRIVDQGMTAEEAATLPKNAPPLHPYCGQMLSLRRIGEIVHVPADTLRSRMRRYGISAQDAADGNFATGRYAYGGEYLSIGQIAQRAGVDVNGLRRILWNRNATAEEAVEILRNPGKPKEPTRKTSDARMDIAVKLIGKIISEPDVKLAEDGSFLAENRFYNISARFTATDRVELTARWGKTGAASLIRRYKISNGVCMEIEAVSL